MRKMAIFAVLAVILAGCASTGNQYGRWSGFGGLGGQMVKHSDPTKPVNPGQVAAIGINGPNGPYAAAYGLAAVPDEAARKDAAETIKEISANEGWSGGRGVAIGSGAFGRRGNYSALGVISNDSPYDLLFIIHGFGQIPIRSGDFREVELPRGNVRYETYHNSPHDSERYGRKYSERSFPTKKPAIFNDIEYDFWLRVI